MGDKYIKKVKVIIGINFDRELGLAKQCVFSFCQSVLEMIHQHDVVHLHSCSPIPSYERVIHSFNQDKY